MIILFHFNKKILISFLNCRVFEACYNTPGWISYEKMMVYNVKPYSGVNLKTEQKEDLQTLWISFFLTFALFFVCTLTEWKSVKFLIELNPIENSEKRIHWDRGTPLVPRLFRVLYKVQDKVVNESQCTQTDQNQVYFLVKII